MCACEDFKLVEPTSQTRIFGFESLQRGCEDIVHFDVTSS